ncbi:MAG: hypothetical protein OXR68_02055 [Alphaproteobacteria bacterium]|nr:hypothetical protein [Alphaproteobacteria bacterium]
MKSIILYIKDKKAYALTILEGTLRKIPLSQNMELTQTNMRPIIFTQNEIGARLPRLTAHNEPIAFIINTDGLVIIHPSTIQSDNWCFEQPCSPETISLWGFTEEDILNAPQHYNHGNKINCHLFQQV